MLDRQSSLVQAADAAFGVAPEAASSGDGRQPGGSSDGRTLDPGACGEQPQQPTDSPPVTPQQQRGGVVAGLPPPQMAPAAKQHLLSPGAQHSPAQRLLQGLLLGASPANLAFGSGGGGIGGPSDAAGPPCSGDVLAHLVEECQLDEQPPVDHYAQVS